MSFKVIIAGGREFDDYELLYTKCEYYLSSKAPDIEIVSGKCPTGADLLGEEYAKDKGYSIKEFPANWKQNGKAAGPIRNKEMAEYADALIAFWDGESKGTANMIDEAKALGLLVKVVNYDPGI